MNRSSRPKGFAVAERTAFPQTCRDVQVFKGCRAHREILPEQITSSRATANLSGASRDWIVNDLGATWYGAFVHQGSFDLKRYGSASTGCSGTCSFTPDRLEGSLCRPRRLRPAGFGQHSRHLFQRRDDHQPACPEQDRRYEGLGHPADPDRCNLIRTMNVLLILSG